MSNAAAVCGLWGFTGVLLGAFGAHALKETLAARGTREIWETAVFYQLIHAAALFAAAARTRPAARTGKRAPDWLDRAAGCWSLGILLFSGSLYALALGGPPRVLGPVTPLGGLAFLAGWGCVIAWALVRNNSAEES